MKANLSKSITAICLRASGLLVSILLLSAVWTRAAEAGVQAWVQRYSHFVDAVDEALKVVTDADGNVLVAGYSRSRSVGADWVVIKYSNAGVALWTNRYNGPGNGDDHANALAADASGNVFVTGYSDGGGFNDDYLTVKYSGAGVPLWTNRYNGPANGVDQATALAVDGSGNVFVTGNSIGSGSNSDYETVAYSGAGMPLWTNRYNGTANGEDQAIAVAVDGSGNVFVSGYSATTNVYPYNYDYATIVYSGAGVPMWTNRYNGPGNGEDRANALAVDSNGHVFVTGYSDGGGFNYGYLTIKYSGAGVALWTNRYNGPGNSSGSANAVAVDGTGNVFVTGGSSTGYATIKYSGEGVPVWTNYYDEPTNSFNFATAIAVGNVGNVFVTGRSVTGGHYDYATVAYSSAGVSLWTNRYDGTGNLDDRANAVAVDGSGNVFVTGSSSSTVGDDYATIKYSGAGALLWTNRYNGPANGVDQATALAVDGSGNVFVVGSSVAFYSYGADGSDGYAVVAYSNAGVPLWTNRFRGDASALAVSSNGNVIVTGSVFGDVSIGYADCVTIAYSSAGVPLWTNRYNGPESGVDQGNAVAVDGSGNVFVTGYSYGGRYYDYATIAYSSTGVPLWTNRYSEFGARIDSANAVAVDGSGNVFVTGYSDGGGSGFDYATIKYSGAGVPLWTNRYNGPGNRADQAMSVAVDGGGNVFVTGTSIGSATNYDYATIAYSNSGVPLWTNRYDGPGNTNDFANAVVVDGNGNAFVTGYSTGIASNYDYATIAYSNSGAPLWTNRYNGPGNGSDVAYAVAVDSSGNVFVTGYSWNGSSHDYATIKYSGAGVPLWTSRYNGPANGDDLPLSKQSLALGPDGSVYVTGASDGDYGSNTTYDFATIKYITVPVLAIERSATDVIVSWPSPFSDFVLQQNTDGIATMNWSNITSSVQDDGTNRSLIINPSIGDRFYRLLKP